MTNVSSVENLATVLFACAILHTFLVKQFQTIASKYPEGSILENTFHLLGEVEVVFGIWSAVLILGMCFLKTPTEALQYLETRNFTEAIFVFAILVVCSTKPILDFAENLMSAFSVLLPLPKPLAFFIVLMIMGPCLGSFITEPAAMTVVALLLLTRYFNQKTTLKFKYAVLGLLFVNISIGGTLTHFAAPPVLMVAAKWGWGLKEMFFNFGLKGFLACSVSTLIIATRFKKEILSLNIENKKTKFHWIQFIHLLFLAAVVLASHHPVLVAALFLFFLGFVQVTQEYQSEIRIKEALLVAFFLAGLVVLGGLQSWWLTPILTSLNTLPLYLGAIGLTAITDNAALTYLGSLVPNLSEATKYVLVAGAVVGGGLTVIANAPNPAGYNILQPAFGKAGISPWKLFKAALLPTLIAALCFWFL